MNILWFYELTYKYVKNNICRLKDFKLLRKGRYAKGYYRLHCGFDIETTQIMELKQAYMYIWVCVIDEHVILGSEWTEFLQLLDWLQKALKLSKTHRLIIWIHNLNYELSFLYKWLNITECFAREKRKAIYVTHNECIELHDSMMITNSSLDYLAKNYTKTQKLVGDLDYSVMRNKTDGRKMKGKSLQYVINDGVILKEFSEFIWSEYIDKSNFLPLTKTGIVRKKVKDLVTEQNRNGVLYCYPDQELYCVMLNEGFRGGYVHANYIYVGKTLDDVDSWDITSSYPATMFHNNFCMDKFKKVDLDKLDKKVFDNYVNSMSCFMVITFEGIKNKTTHSIESGSKCRRLEGATLDNGRVVSASLMTVAITQIDYAIYKMYYKWESMTIHVMHTARQGKLPQYLLQPLLETYSRKNALKVQGLSGTLEYMLQKNDVNSFYGMCVYRHPVFDITLTKEGWNKKDTEQTFEKLASKDFLLPQWGLEITAYSRYKLLKMVYDMDRLNKKVYKTDISDVIYCDTDSIKFRNGWKYYDLFKKVNKKIEKINRGMFPGDVNMLDIGTFDNETKIPGKPCYFRFKTLGAKRYIYVSRGGKKNTFGSTISGLKKGVMQEHYKNNKHRYKKNGDIGIFDMFENGLEIEVSHKLVPHYEDNATEHVVNGETMSELTSCCLYPVTFKITMNKLWLLYLSSIPDKFRKI